MRTLCPYCYGISCWSLDDDDDSPALAVMRSLQNGDWYMWWSDGEKDDDGNVLWLSVGPPITHCPNCGRALQSKEAKLATEK